MFRYKAFALVEVVVASAILLIIALSFIMSLVYAQRAAAMSALDTAAAHMLAGEIERIRADDYSAVTPDRYADATPQGTRRVFLDAQRRVPVTVNYDIVSTFPVVHATSSSIRVGGIPDNAIRHGRFQTDEWVGNTLTIIKGTGITQRAWIRANSHNEFQVTADTTGATQRNLAVRPGIGSVVQLNHGKTVTVRLQWSLFGREFTNEMHTLMLPRDF